MDKLLTIKDAAKILGVSTSTLRRWEREGVLKADSRTMGNQRRYSLKSIKPEYSQHKGGGKTICYARVSSKDQRKDLGRQAEVLELYCAVVGGNLN